MSEKRLKATPADADPGGMFTPRSRREGPSRREQGDPGRMSGDGGAALVEFALVLPVLSLMLFGIIEFGINLNDYQTLRQSVRDTARNAIVGDYGNAGACAQGGSSATNNANAMICTTRATSGLGTSLAVRVVFTDNNGSTDYSTDRVKVCAVTPVKSVTGIMAPFLQSRYLKASVETRAEKALTLTTTQSGTDPSGGSWSWC